MIKNIFIQARMSSERFPGKVLAPLNGVPLIKRIIDNCKEANHADKIVVLTSTQLSDDPLAVYLASIDCAYYRGDLDNVFERFQAALLENPCDYFVRLCGDSPFIDANLLDALLEKTSDNSYDLISNVYSRKFPKGQSVEIIKADTFKTIHSDILSDHEREHVTPYFYTNKEKYKCLFLEAQQDLSALSMCVDTFADLKNLEQNPVQFSFQKQDLCVVI